MHNFFLGKVSKNISDFTKKNNFEFLSPADKCKAIKAEIAKRYFYLNDLKGYRYNRDTGFSDTPENLLACKVFNQNNIEPLWDWCAYEYYAYQKLESTHPGHVVESDYNYIIGDSGIGEFRLPLSWKLSIYNKQQYQKDSWFNIVLHSEKQIQDAKSIDEVLRFKSCWFQLNAYSTDGTNAYVVTVDETKWIEDLDPDVWDLSKGHVDKTLGIKNAVYAKKVKYGWGTQFDVDLRFDYRDS